MLHLDQFLLQVASELKLILYQFRTVDRTRWPRLKINMNLHFHYSIIEDFITVAAGLPALVLNTILQLTWTVMNINVALRSAPCSSTISGSGRTLSRASRAKKCTSGPYSNPATTGAKRTNHRPDHGACGFGTCPNPANQHVLKAAE
jgi:hypothetical protein